MVGNSGARLGDLADRARSWATQRLQPHRQSAAFLGGGVGRQLGADEHHQQTLRLCLLLGGAQQVGKFDDIHDGNFPRERASGL